MIFPRDPKGGGTWIAASTTGRVACLLNGAFKKHHHSPPYRMSRGLIVLDMFRFPTVQGFLKNYRLDNIEPFTLIICEKGSVHLLVWDEREKHIFRLDPLENHIWSSCTLYGPEIRPKRSQWFEEWLVSGIDKNVETVIQLHKTGGTGDPVNDYVMNRDNKVRTVSITSVLNTPQEITMQYEDILHGNKDVKKISVDESVLIR
jgi:hypothetical protein